MRGLNGLDLGKVALSTHSVTGSIDSCFLINKLRIASRFDNKEVMPGAGVEPAVLKVDKILSLKPLHQT